MFERLGWTLGGATLVVMLSVLTGLDWPPPSEVGQEVCTLWDGRYRKTLKANEKVIEVQLGPSESTSGKVVVYERSNFKAVAIPKGWRALSYADDGWILICTIANVEEVVDPGLAE
jgi:hypothetical protein